MAGAWGNRPFLHSLERPKSRGAGQGAASFPLGHPWKLSVTTWPGRNLPSGSEGAMEACTLVVAFGCSSEMLMRSLFQNCLQCSQTCSCITPSEGQGQQHGTNGLKCPKGTMGCLERLPGKGALSPPGLWRPAPGWLRVTHTSPAGFNLPSSSSPFSKELCMCSHVFPLLGLRR